MIPTFELLQIVTVVLGCISLTLSGLLTAYFLRSRMAIGKALAWMLAAETVAVLVTVIFSIGANGIFNCINEYHSLFLRWTLFGFASATSLHLAYTCRVIELKAIKEFGEKNKED